MNHKNVENKKLMTLCIIKKGSQILLGMKKRGFGAGRWNGFGGKVNEGETIEEAAKREVEEEAGIKLNNITASGVIEFEFLGDPEILEVHFFRSEDFSGEPTESEEMRPAWFSVDKIPFKDMWPDDEYWMPLFLKRREFRGRFVFDEKGCILAKELSETGRIV